MSEFLDESSIKLHINTQEDDIISNRKNGTEIVYRPTTMESESKCKDSMQSLKPDSNPKDSLYLYRTTFLGNLLGFSVGIGFSWSSPVLPKLHEPESPINGPVNSSDESLIASSLYIGAFIGPFLFGYMADKIGRKNTLITTTVPIFIGMIILAFTDQLKMFYLGRLIIGIGMGGAMTVLTMYIGEITADHNRGKFSCILAIFLSLGVLYPFSVGSYLTVKIFTLSCLLPLQLFVIFFTLYAPDSPPYLVRVGKLKQAENTLVNLHSLSKPQAQKDIVELQRILEKESQESGGFAELFRGRGTRKAFIIAGGLLVLQQFSGIGAVIGFMEGIFRASGSNIPSEIATTIVGVLQVFTVFITSLIIDKLGRKFLLLISTLGSAVSIILLALYFYLLKNNFSMLSYFWWLPITSLLLYIVSFNFGLGPIPWTILSEIFPDNVKSSAASMATGMSFGMSFVVILGFPIINGIVGMAGSFWLFGIVCILGSVFIYFVVIETKGKSARNLLAFSGGLPFSWSSPVLPKLHGPESTINGTVTSTDESIIASSLSVGAFIGPFIFGYLADKIGRKKTLILISIPMSIGMLIIAFTDQIKLVYLGRLINGIGTGGTFTVLTMYIGEVTANHNRGKYSCILGVYIALGVLYPLAVGSSLSIKTFTLSCILPLEIFLIFFTLYAPESPQYLVRIGKLKKAEKALVNLHSLSKEQAQKDIMELQRVLEKQNQEGGGYAEIFKGRATRKAFIISAGCLVLQQLSGINAITGYMEGIFIDSGSTIPPELAAALVGVIQVIFSYVTAVLIEKLGRKFLLFTSASGSAVSIILLGLYFYLQRINFSMLAYFWWLPVTSLVFYIIAFNLGIGPIAWTIMSEIFPDNVKSSGASLVTAISFVLSFIVTLAFPIISDALGLAGSFWLFGICCILGSVFVHFVVFETKGKSMSEIQAILNGE
ncbi:hypothetical protein ABEB36_008435 [Hypothenemus hampei]|uniref:Major facilitator superfamily (MFS) profile domain-containing protein n=1 Tax=Hypothenemus hampei TaxID=57062 RepID=A0ABD1ELZ2_HYPHA